MDTTNSVEFTAEQVEKINAVAQKSMGGGWSDDEKPQVKIEKKEGKLLNGRYKKIKKLGQGSYNVVYLAEDLLPQGKARLLAANHLEMIGKISEKIVNPYR